MFTIIVIKIFMDFNLMLEMVQLFLVHQVVMQQQQDFLFQLEVVQF